VKRVATTVAKQAVEGAKQAVEGVERLATELKDRVV
jgi:hypothetical protein